MRLDTELVDGPLHLGDVFLALAVACRIHLELDPMQFAKQFR